MKTRPPNAKPSGEPVSEATSDADGFDNAPTRLQTEPPPADTPSFEDAPTLEDAPTRRLGEAASPTLTSSGERPPRIDDEHVGVRVGKILILELLGVGGMGRVYAGWDEKLERRVALKSIRRRHAPSDEVKARFLQEAQILSKLQHPNICQIYDYIEGEDADYLVLELIDGKTLVDFDRGALSTADRLDLAIQLADVLAAAHAAGVVHRDLKPANVMVTGEVESGDLQAKMLDFGIARSVGDDHSRRPRAAGPRVESGFETQDGFLVGTPQYMSPEQARGESATPASDMYSFGLLLQELFTGKPSYDPKLSTLALLGAVQEGKTEPVAGLGPDLTLLIERLKAPAQGARPSAPDTAEQLRRIVDAPRRKRLKQLRIAAFVVLSLMTAWMTFQAFRIEQERQRAEQAAVEASREAETARQVLDVLLSLFEASDPWKADAWKTRGEELTVREVLARGAERLEEELPDRPLVRGRLLTNLGEIHHKLGLFDDSRQLLEASLETRRQANAPAVEIAETLRVLGFLSQLEGDFDDAEQVLLESLEVLDARSETVQRTEAERDQLAMSLDRLGRLYSERGPLEKAAPLLEQALEIRRDLQDRSLDVAHSLHHLGNLNEQQGQLELAQGQLEESLAIREDLLDPGHPLIAKTLNALGIVHDRLRERGLAEEAYRRALELMEPRLDPDEPQLAVTRMNLGSTLRAMGQYDDAAALYKQALESLERRLGPDYPRVGEVLGNLGLLHLDMGLLDEAKGYFERARVIFIGAFGEIHPSVAMCLKPAAGADFWQRRHREAIDGYQSAREIFAATFGERHRSVADTLGDEARVWLALGEPDEARPLIEQALEIGLEAVGAEHQSMAELKIIAARLERQGGNLDRAEELLLEARQILDGAGDIELRRMRSNLAREQANLSLDRGRLDEALESFDLASELLHARHGERHPIWIGLLEDHASALRAAGRVEGASAIEKRASELKSFFGVSS